MLSARLNSLRRRNLRQPIIISEDISMSWPVHRYRICLRQRAGPTPSCVAARTWQTHTLWAISLNLAYVQGSRRDSKLDPELWQEISSKLNRYGGLYIYRDGIRVLPYGNSDFDFLDIELRRAKSASDAFFSYRRMFGVIDLTRDQNSQLREKAGREGFADNEAYRQFREILRELFVSGRSRLLP